MKKIIVLIVSNIFIANCIAQKIYNVLFMGTNFTAGELTSATNKQLNSNNFKDGKLGLNFGYKFMLPISNLISLSAGFEYERIGNKFSRQHYDNSITGDPRSVFEDNKNSRLIIPVQGYLNFVSKDKLRCYVTLGAGIIVMNKINREVEYYIPTAPSGYTKNFFTGKQYIGFGDAGKSIGITLISGIGSAFEIKERNFVLELIYVSDASKNTMLTLHNIEYDSYFFNKFKGIELTLGTSFSFKSIFKK